MQISDMLRKGFLDGFSNSELTIPNMILSILCAAALGLFIFLLYRIINRGAFYSRTFNLSLIALAVITAAIILTIQSNIVVSLGMVGALSIVRFRTAIKDPMDLIFLFWSIAVGIICGAGYAVIAIIASAVLTIVIVVFSVLPAERDTLKNKCSKYRVRARNVAEGSLNLAVEVKTRHPRGLIEALMESKAVLNVSLVEHDGEVTA